MKFSSISVAALLGVVGAAPLDARNGFESDALAAKGAVNLGYHVAKNGYPNPQKCTLETAAVRREWSTLASWEKKDYINAVKCLAKKPAKTPAGIAAGAKNRYDDFVATHINQTLAIHGTGNFLTWHRYFTWTYEQVLRNECGYKGYQPYYNWPWWANDPLKSPTFDGSTLSLSGDGAFVAGRNNTCIPSPAACGISLPPSHGGGCVKSGPFKDWSVNLGPVAPVLADAKPNPEFTGLGYNPRCLRRDISKIVSQGWTKDSDVASLIKNGKDFLNFTTTMQGDFANGFLGVHTGGHFTIGGDPGGDLFASPGDPAFFLHHAMIDRTYWTWQNLDLDKRLYALGGTITVNNSPPSRNATLDDVITLGYVGVPDVTIKEASSTFGGPFCYIYV
ncbi:Di-copper centre-containing protein [Cucurbitaria berberidis CBS 394.84]|uniref:Di-copper centre-containing protein n=1 Tax=Cucurbitaria berberidis CBS 394.84 TaxID=1168544 RepID=A0A9P4GIJ9_9PLEO|nr:Di-copper centre-containing protein [Cucurbitaria berberidis CBS 394.84]KAF1846119.1 Di-copper centre-containing protein [Cucurbitaria berberidis CBS 394.84]